MPIAAAISGAAALGATAINNFMQKRRYEQQLKDERQNWYMNNQYNSPSSQMARLKAAGLNPNLVYQNGAAVQPSSMPSTPDFPYTPIDGSSIAQSMFQSRNIEQDTQLLKAQTDEIEAGRPYWSPQKNREVAKLDAEINETRKKTDFLGKQIGLTDVQITNEVQKTPLIRAEIRNLADTHKINKQTLDNLEAEYYLILNENDIAKRNVLLADLNVMLGFITTGAEARKNGYIFSHTDYKFQTNPHSWQPQTYKLDYDKNIDYALQMFKEQKSQIERDNSWLNRGVGYTIGIGNMVSNFLPSKQVSDVFEKMTVHDKYGKAHTNTRQSTTTNKSSKW